MKPVLPGVVDHPAEDRWSSYGANAHGLASANHRGDFARYQLGEPADLRASAYREFISYQLYPGLVEQVRAYQ